MRELPLTTASGEEPTVASVSFDGVLPSLARFQSNVTIQALRVP